MSSSAWICLRHSSIVDGALRLAMPKQNQTLLEFIISSLGRAGFRLGLSVATGLMKRKMRPVSRRLFQS